MKWSRLVAGANYDTDLLDAGTDDFLDEDGQRSLRHAVAIHEGL